ncbi:uncharacterized protein [Rutidosis leptorrhynchoides]|uniref:uncharacterized protein n=1 Tax=Rutidosis leptorrhynchoides TaxID=125765 RepID=UPI003A99A53F
MSDEKKKIDGTLSEAIPIAARLTDNKLNGSNFFEWSKTIRVYLRSMGKDSHLTSEPPKDDTRDLWLQNDARLFLQIMNSIESSVTSLVNHCEYVKELMEYLDFLYSGKSNISRVFNVCKFFHRGEQHDRSLMAYVMEFKKIYEEFNSVMPLSADIKTMQTQREQIAVMSFLTGLRPEHDAIKSQFLNESTIPSLQETFARVLRHEDVKTPQVSEHNTALISRGGFRGGGRSRGGYRGSYRGSSRGGHTDRITEEPTNSGVECFYCHELGHTKRYCKKLQTLYMRNNLSAHAASSSTVTISANEHAEYTRLKESVKPTTSTVAFAETCNDTCLLSSTSKWVIDSGASDHMTGNNHLYSDFNTHSSYVTIANGTTSLVLGSGTINLTPSISLSSVLCLPNFSFNLLSVSKLTRDLNCVALLFPDSCIFQDLSTK